MGSYLVQRINKNNTGNGFLMVTFIDVQSVTARLKKMEAVLICNAQIVNIIGAGYVDFIWMSLGEFLSIFIYRVPLYLN